MLFGGGAVGKLLSPPTVSSMDGRSFGTASQTNHGGCLGIILFFGIDRPRILPGATRQLQRRRAHLGRVAVAQGSLDQGDGTAHLGKGSRSL